MMSTTTRMYPSAALHAAERPVPRETPAAADDAGLLTVLVVDDEPAIRDIASRILRRAHYTVLTAADGPSALHLASEHPGTIHYLLTDVVMPYMLGNELARRLTAARPDTRVLYMSGYAEPMLADRASAAAQVRLLDKPFTPDQLLTALADLDEPDQ
jgi:two-component system, cell cycle sensor histidine kinase and response regulator CckA